MKFVMIVLTIHFVAEVISRKRKDNRNKAGEKNETVFHPAEFNTR